MVGRRGNTNQVKGDKGLSCVVLYMHRASSAAD